YPGHGGVLAATVLVGLQRRGKIITGLSRKVRPCGLRTDPGDAVASGAFGYDRLPRGRGLLFPVLGALATQARVKSREISNIGIAQTPDHAAHQGIFARTRFVGLEGTDEISCLLSSKAGSGKVRAHSRRAMTCRATGCFRLRFPRSRI